jgi:O-antigen/teichoic acid export membrane protein
MPSPVASLARLTRDHLPLLRDIAGTSGARIYSILLSLAALMLTARWLGPEGRGIVVVITTWVTMIAGLAHLSVGQVLVHRAANRADEEWIGPALAAAGLITAAASLAGWGAAWALYAAAGRRLFEGIPAAALALGLASLPFFVWEQYGSAFLSIIGRLRAYNLAQIAGRTLGLLLLILLIGGLGLGIYGFLIAFVAGQVLVSGAGAAVLAAHARGRIKGGVAAVGALVRDGLKLHINAIGVLLFSGVDILMLQYFRGPAETAVFQLPMQLFLALLLVPQAAQLALQGRVAARNRSDFWREHRAVMGLVIAGMTVAAVVLWLLAPWIVLVVGGAQFDGSGPLFRILLFGLPCACFNTLMAIQWITRGYFYQASMITLGTGATNVVLNLILIPTYGATGAAAAAALGMCAVPLLSNGWMAMKAQRELDQAGKRSALG